MSVGNAVRNPRGFAASKWSTLKLLLTAPGEFYETKGTSDRLWTEIGVLLVIGLASTAGGLFLARTIMSNLYTGSGAETSAEYGVSGDVGIQIWAYGLRGVVGILLLWIGFSVALYLVSWLYSPYGSFFAVAKNTAWALVPLLIGNAIKSLTYVIAGWNAWGAGTIEVEEGDLVQSAGDVVTALFSQVLDEPAAVIGVLLTAVFVAWCGYIAAYGIADVRDIAVSDARLVAAVPTVLYIGYLVYGVITLVGLL